MSFCASSRRFREKRLEPMALTELDLKGSLLRDMVSALASHGGVGDG
jgi:hypothetical protein